jgi:trehalose-phosphatase
MKLLLATDFDGTVAPIRPTPEDVEIDPLLLEVLKEATEHPAVTVALLSGRDLDDLASRVAGLPVYLSGSHGLELRDPAGSILRTAPVPDIGFPEHLLEMITRSGARLEWKKYGVALHWRGVSGIDQSSPAVRAFADWARNWRMETIGGRAVLEARMPGMSKADVLREIAERTAAGRVIYAGDDTTDVPALQWAATRGRGIFLLSAEREIPHGVETAASRKELAELLRDELLAAT